MTRKTGWPQEMFLMQDDCSKLSRWFASRIDARETIRRVFRQEKGQDMTQEIKPCPWCEGTSVSVTENAGFRWRCAVCDQCGACAPEVRKQTLGEGTNEEWEKDAERRAIESWNERA